MPTGINASFVGQAICKEKWSGPVIDLGAGSCSDWYQHFFADAKYLKLDFLQNPISHIDIIADILNMPEVPSNTYGVALLLETLEHLENPFTAFAEIKRILRPGGMLICTTVACWAQHGHPGDYFRFLPDGLRALCESINFKIFHEALVPDRCDIPCHCMIAAIKQ